MRTLPLITLLASLLVATPVLADATPTPTADAHLAAIQARGDTDITTRITSLNGLISDLNGAKRLTAAQKTSLIAEITAQITQLTALKTKLDADTNVDTAQTDFQTIFSQHYVYAFYLPRTARLIAADREADAAALMLGMTDKLQAYIARAQAQGSDVSALNASLADLKAKAADAQGLAQTVIASLTPLTAAGYPANKTAVDGATASLKTGRSDLASAQTDAQSIISGLRKVLTDVQ